MIVMLISGMIKRYPSLKGSNTEKIHLGIKGTE